MTQTFGLKMEHVSKLTISILIDDDKEIGDALKDLPDYCASTFTESGSGWWYGDFQISCPSAPKLADGDFVDDLCPYFPALLALKRFYSAEFELHIAVGSPAEEFWTLDPQSVALLAVLGASIDIQTAAWTNRTEQGVDRKPDHVSS